MAVKTMGDRIRDVREERGFSASDLARLTGVTPTAVSNWENRGRTPRAGAMASICKVLGVSESYIVSGKGALSVSKVTPVQVEKQIDSQLEIAGAAIAGILGVGADRLRVRFTYS